MHDHDPPRLLVIAAPPRSGSTFTRSVLGAHAAVTLSNEAGWTAVLLRLETVCRTPVGDEARIGDGFWSAGVVPAHATEPMQAAFEAATGPFVDAFFARLRGASTGPSRVVGDKVHSVEEVEFLRRTFPRARFVFLVRDLRDVLVSSYRFQEKGPTAWDRAGFEARCEHVAAFCDRVPELVPEDLRVTVRYEDLMQDPETHVERMLRLVDLQVDDGVRAWLRDDAARLFSSHGTSTSVQDSIGRWRTGLDEDQQRLAEDLLGTANRRLGYA